MRYLTSKSWIDVKKQQKKNNKVEQRYKCLVSSFQVTNILCQLVGLLKAGYLTVVYFLVEHHHTAVTKSSPKERNQMLCYFLIYIKIKNHSHNVPKNKTWKQAPPPHRWVKNHTNILSRGLKWKIPWLGQFGKIACRVHQSHVLLPIQAQRNWG